MNDNIEKTVSFYTLGCRLNIAETGTITQSFKDEGYQILAFENETSVTVINTCTVTIGADSTCRNIIRKAKKYSPNGKIVVVGCYAQLEFEAISKMEEVDLILGNSDKFKISEYLKNVDDGNKINVSKNVDFFSSHTTIEDRHTRAFLKVQDGCNYFCSYCIIPFARGRSRAIKIDQAVKEVSSLVESGFKEIVLTGVNIGEYRTSKSESFSDLVKEILKISNLDRLRISSIEPNVISDDLLKSLADSNKFMDHFHIPLQSGDDQMLGLMKRKYSTADFKEVVEKVLKYFPQGSIGTDVIVGHPGETDELFLNTLNFIRELPISHFHIFPYSLRKGTVSSEMSGAIENRVKKERAKQLIKIGDDKYREFCVSNIKNRRSFQVLFEKKNRLNFGKGILLIT